MVYVKRTTRRCIRLYVKSFDRLVEGQCSAGVRLVSCLLSSWGNDMTVYVVVAKKMHHGSYEVGFWSVLGVDPVLKGW